MGWEGWGYHEDDGMSYCNMFQGSRLAVDCAGTASPIANVDKLVSP